MIFVYQNNWYYKLFGGGYPDSGKVNILLESELYEKKLPIDYFNEKRI